MDKENKERKWETGRKNNNGQLKDIEIQIGHPKELFFDAPQFVH